MIKPEASRTCARCRRFAGGCDDPEVVGLLPKLGSTSITLAQAQELAESISAFRGKGKTDRRFAETFGELGRAPPPYLVGVSFEELWAAALRHIGLMGAAGRGTSCAALFDRAHVEPLFSAPRVQNAVVPPGAARVQRAHRRGTERLTLLGLFEQVVAAVADAAKISEDQVRGLIDRHHLRRRGTNSGGRRSPRLPGPGPRVPR